MIDKGAYVLATKYADGDPGDQWSIGFYDRFEGGRHYVVDEDGQQFRGNGFRRCEPITSEVGRHLIPRMPELERTPPGEINVWDIVANLNRT
ncbi:MAG: hypothetical protein JWR51_4637 [Devosia sp.]|uniref:hypothetical protein n=1 Tax=Devosia sp. TaxID=1871048 RepID=UPI00260F7020|nr:hypothetical protein [Devosia sp.]MDB5531534.1 hypothetical protein [Devosia sp.]